MKTLARLVGPVPSHDHPIELQNLLLESEQLSTERGKAGTGNLRDPLLVRVGNNAQQFCDPFTPDWRDNAELSEVRPDRINHRGDFQIAALTSNKVAPTATSTRPGQLDLSPNPLAGLSGSKVPVALLVGGCLRPLKRPRQIG
jgi:hypothetical protein